MMNVSQYHSDDRCECDHPYSMHLPWKCIKQDCKCDGFELASAAPPLMDDAFSVGFFGPIPNAASILGQPIPQPIYDTVNISDLLAPEGMTTRETNAEGKTLITHNFTPNQPEPAPIQKEGAEPIWNLVIADMRERNEVGTKKYGTPLQAFNGRNALVDLYREVLDLAVYLKQCLVENEKK